MTSKKIIALALTVAATLSLAACSSGTSAASAKGIDGTGKTLHVLVSAKAAYPTQQKAWFSHVSNAFKKRTGATVQFDTFATTADEQKKIQTATVSGSGPDIFSLGISLTPVADATGSFIKLDSASWAKVGGRSRFVPAALGESGRTKSTEIAVPFISRPYVLAYNTEMFKDAGIAAPPTSWDEFVADAKKLTHGDVYGAATDYADPYDPWKFAWTMSALQGNTMVDGKKARFDDASVRKAYETYYDFLTRDKIVDPSSVSWMAAQALTAFADGKAAMLPMVITSGSYPTLDASAVKGKWAYATMPTIPAGSDSRPKNGIDAASTISGDNMVVADYSPNKDLALELIKLLTSKKEQLHYFDVFGELPANAAAAKEVVAAHPEYKPVLAAQKRSVPTPYTGAWSDIQIALGNVVVQSLPGLSSGSVPPATLKSLLAKGQQTTQKALDRVGGQ